jgi:hypothetical protein
MAEVKCLGSCKKTYLVSAPGSRLPMPNVWRTDGDGRISECRTCGGPVSVTDLESCLSIWGEETGGKTKRAKNLKIVLYREPLL